VSGDIMYLPSALSITFVPRLAVDKTKNQLPLRKMYRSRNYFEQRSLPTSIWSTYDPMLAVLDLPAEVIKQPFSAFNDNRVSNFNHYECNSNTSSFKDVYLKIQPLFIGFNNQHTIPPSHAFCRPF